MRILITGSRAWTDDDQIYVALDNAAGHLPADAVTLVSGACPSGADRIAEDIASATFGWLLETHPADWKKHGRRAGFVRNAEMVALGADICLAFIKDGSRGASMTADLADKAGITTARYTA
jgi:hypothetical protein